MRKVIVLTLMSLDGVMQRPCGPAEETSGDFNSMTSSVDLAGPDVTDSYQRMQ